MWCKKSVQYIYLVSLASLVLLQDAFAATETMADYTTCAVYQRMTIGAMRRQGNLDVLVNGEREKMNQFTELAKQAGIEEYGEELSEEIFNDEWQAILGEMTDQINHNYDNFSRLRLIYRERCNGYL